MQGSLVSCNTPMPVACFSAFSTLTLSEVLGHPQVVLSCGDV